MAIGYGAKIHDRTVGRIVTVFMFVQRFHNALIGTRGTRSSVRHGRASIGGHVGAFDASVFSIELSPNVVECLARRLIPFRINRHGISNHEQISEWTSTRSLSPIAAVVNDVQAPSLSGSIPCSVSFFRRVFRLMPRIWAARTWLPPVSWSTARSSGFSTSPTIRS